MVNNPKIDSDSRRGKSLERDVHFSTLNEKLGTRNKEDELILGLF